jgi:hypothetical protein
MLPTAHTEANRILDILLERIHARLPQKLIGLYLTGSLVYGDFDPDGSDLDLVAVISASLDDGELAALAQMHQALAREYRRWDERIEVIYVTLDGLQTFRTQPTTIAITSPGEPFHTLEAGHEWLVNWYLAREQGMTLFGPRSQSVIPAIAVEEFVETIRHHTLSWAEWINDCRHLGGQAYARLTMCRALYTLAHGAQISKVQAAAWAIARYPQWATVIQDALHWRYVEHRDADNEETQGSAAIDPDIAFAETVRFVHFAIAQASQ